MLIMVQTLTGKGVEINIQPTDTVLRIKELFEEKECVCVCVCVTACHSHYIRGKQ